MTDKNKVSDNVANPDPNYEYGFRSRRSLNTDPIRIRIRNTAVIEKAVCYQRKVPRWTGSTEERA